MAHGVQKLLNVSVLSEPLVSRFGDLISPLCFLLLLFSVHASRMVAVVNHVLLWGRRLWHSKLGRRYAFGSRQPNVICGGRSRQRTQALRASGSHPNDIPAIFGGHWEVWFVRGTVWNRLEFAKRLRTQIIFLYAKRNMHSLEGF